MGEGWTLLLKTLYLGHRAWMIQAVSDPKSFFPMLSLSGFRKLCKLIIKQPYSASVSVQQLSAWQDIYKGAVNATHTSMATNRYLIGLEAHHTEGNPCLVYFLKTSRVMDIRKNV